MNSPSPNQLVEFVIRAYLSNYPKADLAAQLGPLGVPEADAMDVIDSITESYLDGYHFGSRWLPFHNVAVAGDEVGMCAWQRGYLAGRIALWIKIIGSLLLVAIPVGAIYYFLLR